MSFKLTPENYYGTEAAMKYFSASQLKDFETCEAMAMAKIRGEYVSKPSKDMLIGSYIDAYFTEDIHAFRGQHPEIFSTRGATKGELRNDFKGAEAIIKAIEAQPVMMGYINSGEKQAIMTGEVCGEPFRCKMDFYFPKNGIVDLKIVASFGDTWVAGQGYLNWVDAWRYTRQMAIYQAVEGNRLPVLLLGATKEKVNGVPCPNLQPFGIKQGTLDTEIDILEMMLPEWAAIKRGEVEPVRCEQCEYCRLTKVISADIPYYEDFYHLA
jgi:hypothetical protein